MISSFRPGTISGHEVVFMFESSRGWHVKEKNPGILESDTKLRAETDV